MRSRSQDTGPATLARNYLQACLLLLVAERPGHGYELLDKLAELGLADVDPGALYRALRRLNDNGLVESRWEEGTRGPARRTYLLTEEGAECLARWSGEVAASSTYLHFFLVRHRQLPAWGGAADQSRAFPSNEGAA